MFDMRSALARLSPQRRRSRDLWTAASDDDEPVRTSASILHLDLDAFFAAVEQRDKPSLRGKPVIVGGVGGRGVVATASYEARTFGVRSAMSTAEARSRCPHAAFLVGRFDAYQAASRAVMRALRELSPLVEPLSLDEAFVDLAGQPARASTCPPAASTRSPPSSRHDVARGDRRPDRVGRDRTSKLIAKIASELDKPDGAVVVAARHRARPARARCRSTVIPGVGPATAERLRQDRRAHGRGAASDQRRGAGPGGRPGPRRRACTPWPAPTTTGPWSPSARPSRSRSRTPSTPTSSTRCCSRRSSTGTPAACASGCAKAQAVGPHGHAQGAACTTSPRSPARRRSPGPTDRPAVVSRLARALLAELDTSGGVRLLGVGVSGLADWIQDDLFAEEEDAIDEPLVVPDADAEARPAAARPRLDARRGRRARRATGPGWVWGSGLGRVTVRFETAETGPGPVRTFAPTIPTSYAADRHDRRRDDRDRRHAAEPHPIARPQLRARRQRLRIDDADDRVAAGDRVVGQEHQGLPDRRHLHRPGDDALARELVGRSALQSARRAVQRRAVRFESGCDGVLLPQQSRRPRRR